MTLDDVQRWLDDYVEAWRTYDPKKIAALFSGDATYAYHPWDEPVRGREAIVADWLTDRDAPNSWEGTYQPSLIDGDRAIATGVTRYTSGKVYSNLWLLRFNQNGECNEFVEWYMLQPGFPGDEEAPDSP
jgi:ketosteroid isomerase-like protein